MEERLAALEKRVERLAKKVDPARTDQMAHEVSELLSASATAVADFSERVGKLEELADRAEAAGRDWRVREDLQGDG